MSHGISVRRRLLAMLFLPLPLVAACDKNTPSPVPPPATAGITRAIDLDGRPFQLHVPKSYDAAAKTPLVVLLHGYTGTATGQEQYFQLTAESDRRGFLYAAPDGTVDTRGKQFWNATPACCDFYGSGVDDSAYLSRLIEKVKSTYSVDAQRVYLIGHSNGGFMAYRMACDHADQITAIVSLAGMATNDPAKCKPARAVTVLQIHGTSDATIRYNGGANAGQSYPSVAGTLALWRNNNGCTDQADTSAPPIDLDSGLAGKETTVTTYRTGCRDGTRVELWSIEGGGHNPALGTGFASDVVTFMLSLSG